MKKVIFMIFITTVLIFLSLACRDSKDDESVKIQLIIASDTKLAINPVSGELQEYLLVKSSFDQSWVIFNNIIDHFDYEKGYEYILLVEKKKNNIVASDAPLYSYSLIRIESKLLKESENLD